jgi:hypothetical protein
LGPGSSRGALTDPEAHHREVVVGLGARAEGLYFLFQRLYDLLGTFEVSAATMQGIQTSHIRMEITILFIIQFLRSYTSGCKIKKKNYFPKSFSRLSLIEQIVGVKCQKKEFCLLNIP